MRPDNRKQPNLFRASMAVMALPRSKCLAIDSRCDFSLMRPPQNLLETFSAHHVEVVRFPRIPARLRFLGHAHVIRLCSETRPQQITHRLEAAMTLVRDGEQNLVR